MRKTSLKTFLTSMCFDQKQEHGARKYKKKNNSSRKIVLYVQEKEIKRMKQTIKITTRYFNANNKK